MAKRAIRITKHIGTAPCVAICAYCSREFKVPTTALRSAKTATESLQMQFDTHRCVGEGASTVDAVSDR
jgi:hypothetical protein